MATQLPISKVYSRGMSEGFTPYMIARVVNAKLDELRLEQIRPQMVYNYDRNGLINGTKNQNATRAYTLDETVAFAEKFVAMRAKKNRVAKTATPSSFAVDDVEAASQYIAEIQPTLI